MIANTTYDDDRYYSCLLFVFIMPFIVINISHKARYLKPCYGVSVPSEMTIADIYIEFSSGIIGKEKALESEYDGCKVI